MKVTQLLLAAFLALSLCGCRRDPRIDLQMDLFLHPESTSPDDVLLQAAIRKRLAANEMLRKSVIHVRVVERMVYLRGHVGSQAAKDEAARIVKTTEVVLNGSTIEPAGPVRNQIEILP